MNSYVSNYFVFYLLFKFDSIEETLVAQRCADQQSGTLFSNKISGGEKTQNSYETQNLKKSQRIQKITKIQKDIKKKIKYPQIYKIPKVHKIFPNLKKKRKEKEKNLLNCL